MQRIRIGRVAVTLDKMPGSISVMRANPWELLPTAKWGPRSIRRLSHDQAGVEFAEPQRVDEAMAALRADGHVVHHVYRLAEDPTQELTIGDLIYLVPAQGVSSEQLQALLDEYRLVWLRQLLGRIEVVRVTLATGVNPIKLLERLQTRAELSLAEPDIVIPNYPFAPTRQGEEWHLSGGVIHATNTINITEAWGVTHGDPAIVIAIVDDGFDLANPDLSGGVCNPSDFTTAVPGPDGLEPGDNSPLADAAAHDFHGTPCAGLAIARGTSDVVGVAPGCSWMPVRFPIGSSRVSAIIGMFRYVSGLADVISCSWGLRPSGYTLFPDTARIALSELCRAGGRRGKGLVICFASGNDNLPCSLPGAKNPNGFEYYDATADRVLGRFFAGKDIVGSWPTVEGVIAVSASNALGRKSRYSNGGMDIVVTAPSDDWLPSSIKSRTVLGLPALCTTDNCTVGLSIDDATGQEIGEFPWSTAQMGGTSGATPLVAGVAGLVLSVNSALTSADVLEILTRAAAKDGLDMNIDPATEVNLVGFPGEFDAGGRSLWYGAGRLDAGAAVRLAVASTLGTK